MKVVFSHEAKVDAAIMNEEGIRLFGQNQAIKNQQTMIEALQLIEQFPFASAEKRYQELTVRVRPFGSHLIIYTVEDSVARILRIRHGREDWQDD